MISCRHCGRQLYICGIRDDVVDYETDSQFCDNGHESAFDYQYRMAGIDPTELRDHDAFCRCRMAKHHAPTFER